jgi:hypothetical protein
MSEEQKKPRVSRPKNGARVKDKGRAFEHEISNYLNEKLGLQSSRALLSGSWSGGSGADLQGTPHLHVEAKRTEALNVKAHLRQAVAAVEKRNSAELPAVITRQNRMATGDSLVVLRLCDFVKMYGAFLSVQFDAKGDDELT